MCRFRRQLSKYLSEGGSLTHLPLEAVGHDPVQHIGAVVGSVGGWVGGEWQR